MELNKLKFNESDFIGKDVSSLPDRVVGRSEYLKKMFDNVAKNELALGRFNSLIDELEKLLSPVYFHAESRAPGAVSSALTLSFGTPEYNFGGFELKNGTHLTVPASGIYLFSINIQGSGGTGKDIRFFIRPGAQGCTIAPQAGDKISVAGCTAFLYKKKGESVYVECAPLGSFTLNFSELTAALLCPC